MASKKIKNVWQEICSFENLYKAYLNARKNKRFRDEVLDFTNNLEDNLFQLREELLNLTYKEGEYKQFYVHEPKKRLIMALPFRDRVVQWAVYQVVNPYFVKGYIKDSYACIKGRGTHQAIQRLHYWLRKIGNKNKDEKWYYLKTDITKYFYRVSHRVVLKHVGKKVKDEELMWYFEQTINSNVMPFGLPLGYNADEIKTKDRLFDVGMPIGSLISQMLANINLNPLDQYCKRILGIKYYIRYMDDVIILHNNKKELHEWKRLIEKFLNEELELHLNNKTAIRPVSLGIEFVGYRAWNTHIKLRKSTALKMKRRLKNIKKQYENGEIELQDVKATMASYHGLMKHCNSYNLQNKIFESFVLVRKNEEKESEC